jgi:uncharacterized protein YecT (DUF1311 family)
VSEARAARGTTVGLEGCTEQATLRTDAQINARAKAIFRLSGDITRKFVAAEKAWLTYRQAGCTSVADVYRGGSAQPVAFGACVASRNKQHLKELASIEAFLGQIRGTQPPTPLTVVAAPTPRFPVPGYDTSGTYPQVRGGGLNPRAVNAALHTAVLADQRAYAPYARKEKPRVQYRQHGVYRTAINRSLVSASTVVVSALLPATREVFPGQNGGDDWLGMTVRVPSGARVRITDLFAKVDQGLRVLATEWKARIRRTDGAPCPRVYQEQYTPTVEHYRNFALTPGGIAVGVGEVAACYRLVATVPYRVMRPYLSKLGSTLIAGVRRAR